MKVTWLGQAGLLFENDKIKVIVDPYLSDTLGEVCEAKRRRMPIRPEYLGIAPDVILLTHAHADHTEPATLKYYLGEDRGEVTVLAARSAYEEAVKLGGGHNYVCMAPHSVWSLGSVTFYAVSAAHSNKHAVGFIIDDGEKTYYVSGDTLYNFDVIDDVLDLAPSGVDVAFLPINGKGCNMHARDAADFAYEINAKCAVPLHWGLFDDVDPASFDFDDAVVLKPYIAEEL